MHMKRILRKTSVFFLALVLLGACQRGNDIEKKKKQLARYKTQLVELTLKIKQLEKELAADTLHAGPSLIPVRTLTLQPIPFSHDVEVSGTVIPEKEAFVSSEINGQIKKIYVIEGQHVKEGQLLLKLNTEVTESSIAEAKAQLALAEKLYEKQKELWDQHIGSEVQYLQAKTNLEAARERLRSLEARLDMAYIKAPFDGIIDEIHAKEGELAAPGRQLVQLLNLDRMKIYADVSETYLQKVHKGDKVEVLFPDLDSEPYRLSVFRKENAINPKSRTFKIEIKLNNPGWYIKPNLFTLVRFRDYHNPRALVVPSEIIKKDIHGYFLYVVRQQGKETVARKVYITPGVFFKDHTQVREGLAAGDRVIVEGYDQVTNGEKIQVTE